MPLRLDDVDELALVLSGSSDQVDRGGAPEDFRALSRAPVALSARRGFTCSTGSGRRTATGPCTPRCRPCSRTRSRVGTGPMSRARCCLMSMHHLSPLVGSA